MGGRLTSLQAVRNKHVSVAGVNPSSDKRSVRGAERPVPCTLYKVHGTRQILHNFMFLNASANAVLIGSFASFACLFHIIGDIPFIDAAAFFLPAFLESGEFFFMAAGADKFLCIALSDQFHLFVADRAAGIGAPGDSLPVSAFSVLADQHLSVFSVDFQHEFPTLGALVPGQIIVAEGAGGTADFLDQGSGVILNLGHELPVGFLPLCDRLETELPLGGQFRAFQISWDKGEELPSFGSDMDFIPLLLHKKTVEQFLDDIRSGGDRSEPSGLTQCTDQFLIFMLHIFYRIFHCRDERAFCEICRRLCLSFGDIQSGDSQISTLSDLGRAETDRL